MKVSATNLYQFFRAKPNCRCTDLPKGERLKLSTIQEEYGEEYHELTAEEKKALVEELESKRGGLVNSSQLTSRGKLKILSTVLDNVQRQVSITVQSSC